MHNLLQTINLKYCKEIHLGLSLRSVENSYSSADALKTTEHATSMGQHLSPRYGHVILVSRYLVLTAVN